MSTTYSRWFVPGARTIARNSGDPEPLHHVQLREPDRPATGRPDAATLFGWLFEPESIASVPVPASPGDAYGNYFDFSAGFAAARYASIEPGTGGLYKIVFTPYVSGDRPWGKAWIDLHEDDTLTSAFSIGDEQYFVYQVGAEYQTQSGAPHGNSATCGQAAATWPRAALDGDLNPYTDIPLPTDPTFVGVQYATTDVVIEHVDLAVTTILGGVTSTVSSRVVLDGAYLDLLVAGRNQRLGEVPPTDATAYDVYQLPSAWTVDQLRGYFDHLVGGVVDAAEGHLLLTYQPASVLNGVLDPHRLVTVDADTPVFDANGESIPVAIVVNVTYRGPRFRWVYSDGAPVPDLTGRFRGSVPGFYTPRPGNPIGVP